jgi:Domain of unknown function (DUF1917)
LNIVGDDDLKASFEKRAARFDPSAFWEAHRRSLQYIAAENSNHSGIVEEDVPVKIEEDVPVKIEKEESTRPAPQNNHYHQMELDPTPIAPLPTLPYNPYEGDLMAKQLSEPLSSFLNRLKPSSTTIKSGPWIWITNPASTHRPTLPNIAGFKDAGHALLTEFMRRKRKLEEANPTKPPSVITRMLKADRDWLEEAILSSAKARNVTCGKWMLFPYLKQVDAVWAKVAKATLEGTLGSSAKVATDDGGDRPERLVCVYTDDFSDMIDMVRVLREMKRLNLVKDGEEERSIYYKCEAYTYLDIVSGNDYKLRASLYSSREIFKEMGENKEASTVE